ncbi:MAG: hypothetical protein COB02_01680 [Candidatus Cloacimonadota bacterium]|nr:MAG: hypothetical protein COB02_01680 [Candidatus Cloacimonadota bacterium]
MNSSKYNYLADNSTDGTSQFGEVGFNFSTQPHERLHLGFQILARELGSTGKYEPRLDWGFADYQINKYISLKVGRFFSPWGLHNEGRDVDILRNTIIPVEVIYSEDAREISLMKGLELHGNFNIGKKNNLEYRFAKGNIDINLNSRFSLELESRLSNLYSKFIVAKGGPLIANPLTQIDMNIDHITAYGFVWNTWVDGLRLSYTSFEPDIDINAQIDISAQAQLPSPQYTFYDFSKDFKTLSLEYVKNKWSYTYERLTYAVDAYTILGKIPLSDVFSYYHQITHRFNEKYELGIVKAKSKNKLKTNQGRIDDSINDLAFTIRVDLDESWVFKVEYHDLKGIGSLRTTINPGLSNTNNQGVNWDMIVAKVTYSF